MDIGSLWRRDETHTGSDTTFRDDERALVRGLVGTEIGRVTTYFTVTVSLELPTCSLTLHARPLLLGVEGDEVEEGSRLNVTQLPREIPAGSDLLVEHLGTVKEAWLGRTLFAGCAPGMVHPDNLGAAAAIRSRGFHLTPMDVGLRLSTDRSPQITVYVDGYSMFTLFAIHPGRLRVHRAGAAIRWDPLVG